jgi:hypothetical protein
MNSDTETDTSNASKLSLHFPSLKLRNRSVRVVLLVLAASLIIGGPTYLIFVLRKFLPYYLLVALGLASFVVGLILFMLLLGGEERQ